MAKPKVHNEWFQPIVKCTCDCGATRKSRSSMGVDCSMYAWGEYVNGKWRTVLHFCQSCFPTRVIGKLIIHAANCGCQFAVCARSGYRLPEWIKLPQTCHLPKEGMWLENRL